VLDRLDGFESRTSQKGIGPHPICTIPLSEALVDDVLNVGRGPRDTLDGGFGPRNCRVRGLHHRKTLIAGLLHHVDEAQRIVPKQETIGIKGDQIIGIGDMDIR